VKASLVEVLQQATVGVQDSAQGLPADRRDGSAVKQVNASSTLRSGRGDTTARCAVVADAPANGEVRSSVCARFRRSLYQRHDRMF
jgi:hypothetical protein